MVPTQRPPGTAELTARLPCQTQSGTINILILKYRLKKSLERLSFLFFFFFPQLFEGPHSWLFFLSSSRIESFPQPPGSPSTQNGKNKGKCFMGEKAERNRSLFKFFLIKRR